MVCTSSTWMSASSTRLGKFTTIISSSSFPVIFSRFSFWKLYNANVSTLDVVPRAPPTIFICLTLFFFFLFTIWFPLLVIQVTDPFSLILSSAFYYLWCIFPPSYCIIPFRLVLFYIFYLFVDVFTEFIHFPPWDWWYFYDYLNPLPGKLLISILFSSFSKILLFCLEGILLSHFVSLCFFYILETYYVFSTYFSTYISYILEEWSYIRVPRDPVLHFP